MQVEEVAACTRAFACTVSYILLTHLHFQLFPFSLVSRVSVCYLPAR
jgi:hypothetical protein